MAEEPAALRVHFVVHHHLGRPGGVSGATHALGDALRERGCDVSYYSFDDAFGTADGPEIPRMLTFPWRVSTHLTKVASRVDVIDATTGDAWVWAWRGRPGTRGAALVTRSHGLEHVASADLQTRARRGDASLSWKYPVYHGGFRLWEVRRSLVEADAQIFLNETDRAAATDFGVSAASSVVMPNGISPQFVALPVVETNPVAARVEIAFVGSWIPRKGMTALASMATELRSRGVPFALRLLGTGASETTVLAAFAPDVRDSVRVVSRFAPAELRGLLDGAEVLAHPSWTEGFSLALVEGMACGLAPVATRSGGAPEIIRDGENGILLPDESGVSLADGVMRLARDRTLLARLRTAAQRDVQALTWSVIAGRTMDVYRAALTRSRARSA